MKNVKYIIACGALVIMAYSQKANAQTISGNGSNAVTQGLTTSSTINALATGSSTSVSTTNTIAPVTAPPAPPIQNTVTQVQSSVLPPQASAQPQVLNLSATLVVQQSGSTGSSNTERSQETTATPLLNTASGFGTPAPLLQIQNGGMQLPLNRISTTE